MASRLTEAENETLVYDLNTCKTTMKDRTPLMDTPPKLQRQIVKLAKRLAVMKSNLFAQIFQLDEQISRVIAFLSRQDAEQEARRAAQEILDDVASDEPDLG